MFWLLVFGFALFLAACAAAIVAIRCKEGGEGGEGGEGFQALISEGMQMEAKGKSALAAKPSKIAKFIFWKMDSCPYCQRFQPAFDALKASARDEGMKVKFVVENDTSKAAKQKITAFPTLQLVTATKVYTYDGDRSPESIMKWMKKHLA